jgi:hypothetical protein
MKLLLPGIIGLVLLTGASGPGPLKDELPSLFTYRGEMARMRLEIAELRNGRGAAAPAWVAKYASALCGSDARYIVEYTDPALGMREADIEAQFTQMHENGLDCTGVRYLGSVGTNQFVFVLNHGMRDIWYLLTLSQDGRSIAKVE